MNCIRFLPRFNQGILAKLKIPRRNYVTDLIERGLVKEVFPSDASTKIDEMFRTAPQRIYAGFDPTADSLHLGNLLILIGLIHFQRTGHTPIAIIGGATGRVGDPSGRSTERQSISNEVIEHNLTCIQKQIKSIFENHEKFLWKPKNKASKLSPVKIVNNYEWYKDIKLIDFISTVGRHFRLGRMLSLEAVKSRLNSDHDGMSFSEFSYQMFQSYDWLQLYSKYKCKFQLGGSDQIGNLTMGHHLIRRATGKQTYGLTIPLLTDHHGNKLGKTADNAMFLDAEKTSPYALYQFFIRIADLEVENLLKLLTFLSIPRINEIMEKHRENPHLRKAQEKLAEHVTLLLHGEAGLDRARQITKALYEGSIATLADLTENEMKSTFVGAPICEILLQPGMTILDVALKANCYAHDKEAMRLISAGGLYVNLNRCQNIAEVISPTVHILKNGYTLIRTGKRNYCLIKWHK